MKFLPNIILSTLLITSIPTFAEKKPSKAVHQQIHTELLANAKSSIDQSAITDYFKLEFGHKEVIDPMWGNLSSESVALISDLLGEAKTHTGKRYRYGAKGPHHFDCSGFTSYVYKQFGYKLDPSSKGQYTEGVKVEKGDLRPGDLVFFKGRSAKGGVGHVGIVVSADNDNDTFTFIHAAISGGIEIQKSTAPYYKQRYVGAKRIITE